MIRFCGVFQNSHRWIRMITVLPPVFSLALMISVQALYDLFRSGTFEVVWLLFALVWGTTRLFAVRYSVKDHESTLEEEYWGFGQFVPVLPLLIPVFQAAQSWSEVSRELVTMSPDQSQAQLISSLHGSGNSSPAQAQISLHTYSSVLSTTALPTSANYTVHNRMITLCKHDFRLEPWYQRNLLLLLSCAISASPILLRGALLTDLESLGTNIFITVCVLLGGSYLAVMVIPLCGLIDCLSPPHYSLSQRHPLSIIRIAIDNNGKAYKYFRRGCSCALPFVSIFLFPWLEFYVAPFFPILGVVAYEVISRV
ncbi:hypothetical protein BJX66DRAFT_149629 [Aspergillus keveii]|uniref:Uncharacterized protein n=1 Tax=Aspergillus keveii TaxID=714993 RepID=A0ABR4GN40_9EURO